METRKVQLSGGTTYTVSLPKQWAEEHGIEAGSILWLQPNDDGSLLVKAASDRSDRDQEVTLNVSTADPEAVRRYIRGLYAVGSETATLVDETGLDADTRQEAERTVEGLSGFELLRGMDTRVQLEMLIEAENVDVRKLALRLRLVALSMQQDAIAALVDDDPSLADQIIDRDHEADKLFIMVTRYFRRALSHLEETEKLGQSRDRLFEYYYTCRQLERVADHAEKMAGFVADPDLPLPAEHTEQIQRLGNRAGKIVDSAADLVLTDADLQDANAVMSDRDAFIKDLEQFDRGLYGHDTPEQAYAAGLVTDSLRRTAEYGANIARIGTQQELRCIDTDSLSC